jgi:hypothetical protein
MADRRVLPIPNQRLVEIIRPISWGDVPKDFEDILKDVDNQVRKIPSSWNCKIYRPAVLQTIRKPTQ